MPSVHAPQQPLRIALVGGGLGGLAFAISLQRAIDVDRANVELTLYEGAHAFAEIGAGVAMGDNAFSAMEYLGLSKEYLDIADDCETVQWRWAKNRPAGVDSKFDESVLVHSTVHRAQLLDIMVQKIPQRIAQFGKRLVKFEVSSLERDATTLYFTDGTTATCDVLVGADGVKSAVRAQLYAEEEGFDASPMYTGTTAARGLLPMELVKSILGEEEAIHPQMYVGKNQHLLTFPIQKGTVINVVAFTTDRSDPHPVWKGGAGVAPIESSALLEQWTEWDVKCQNLLKAIKEPSQWALFELPDLPYFTKDRIVLLGDSGAATLPHQGAGAAQAIEGGIILAALLAHPFTSHSTILHTLKTYDDLRRKRSIRVKTTSHELGDIIEFSTPAFEGVGHEGLKEVFVREANLQRRYDWIWEWRAEEAIKVAIETLTR